MKGGKPITNREAERAFALKVAGRTWGEVGRIIAEERGRRTPYTAKAIGDAARAWQRGGK